MNAGVSGPCGWLPDPPLTYEAIGAAVAFAGADLDLGAIPDEGSIPHPEWDPRQVGSSCTGHGLAEVGYGLTGKKLSPYHSYYWGLVHDQGTTPTDNGVSTRSVLDSAAQHGLCLWDDWNPASPGFDLLTPPPALARARAQALNLDLVPIFSYGAEATAESVCAAIARGLPSVIVVRVDQAFDHVGSDGLVGPEDGGPVRGLHLITCWAYKTLPNGSRLVRALCHWGPRFADNGGVWLPSQRLQAAPFIAYGRNVS